MRNVMMKHVDCFCLFLKNIYEKKIIIIILNFFDMLMSKKKFKTVKIYFNIFLSKKYFKKQLLP
jgi:hypothetical protein